MSKTTPVTGKKRLVFIGRSIKRLEQGGKKKGISSTAASDVPKAALSTAQGRAAYASMPVSVLWLFAFPLGSGLIYYFSFALLND
jgi:hypothetical protein